MARKQTAKRVAREAGRRSGRAASKPVPKPGPKPVPKPCLTWPQHAASAPPRLPSAVTQSWPPRWKNLPPAVLPQPGSTTSPARRRRQGHDLSLLPRQGEPVPGTRAHDAVPVVGASRRRPWATAGARHRGDDRRDVRARDLRHPPQGRHSSDPGRGRRAFRSSPSFTTGKSSRVSCRRCGRCSRRAVERGELTSDALARFPQLLIAPALVAMVWNGMFDRFAPLDVRELMRAHIDLLFGERSAVMTAARIALFAALLARLVLAGCNNGTEPTTRAGSRPS